MTFTDIVLLDCAGIDSDAAEWRSRISPLRLEKLSRLRRIEDRRMSMGTELALLAALRLHGCGNAEYFYAHGGKPEMVSGSPFISLSHSGGFAVCAVSDFPIGIDIEFPRAIRSNIAARVLSDAEAEYAVTDEYLLEKWVIKESFLKLTGDGLRRSMASFSAIGGRIICGEDQAYYRFRRLSSPDCFISCCSFENTDYSLTVLDEAAVRLILD